MLRNQYQLLIFIGLACFGMHFVPLVVIQAQDKAIRPADQGKAGQPKAIPLEMADDGLQFAFLGFSPDSNTLVYSVTHFLGKQQPTMVFYDLKERKKVKTLISAPDPFKQPSTIVFLPDSKRLIVSCYGVRHSYLLDWRAEKFTELECAASEASLLDPLVLTPKGDYLIGIGSRSSQYKVWGPREFHVWELATAKKVGRFGGERDRQITHFCVSDDCQFLVAEHWALVKEDRTNLDRIWTALFSVRVWDLAGGKEIGVFGKPREITFGKGDNPSGKILKELVGSVPRCRVRISPAGMIMVVPVVPRETVLEAEVTKGGSLSVRELATGNELDKLDQFTTGVGPQRFGFSPDQKTLAASGGLMVGGAKMALFAWDVSAYRDKAIRSKPNLSIEQMGGLWAKFAQRDADQAYRALRQLAAVPERTVPFLKQKLKPAPDHSSEIAKLLSQLADAQLAGKARERLVEIGDEGLPILVKAIKDSSEEKKRIMAGIVARIKEEHEPAATTRQALWTIELLEYMASAESLEFLGQLADGALAAWLTQEAKASIKRIKIGT
jgi:hypothetical protein